MSLHPGVRFASYDRIDNVWSPRAAPRSRPTVTIGEAFVQTTAESSMAGFRRGSLSERRLGDRTTTSCGQPKQQRVKMRLMGSLFPHSDEYPDYGPIPRFTARLGHEGPIVSLAIAATLFGLCPIVLEDHEHPIHEDHRPISYRVPAVAVSSTSTGGSVLATPSTGSLTFTGYVPTIVIAPSSEGR